MRDFVILLLSFSASFFIFSNRSFLSLIEVGFILLFSINRNLLFCAVYRNI